MKKLYAGYTQYQLLIFLLLKDKNDEITFILPKYLEKLGEKLKKNKVIILEQEKPQLRKILKFLGYYKYIKKLVKTLNISEDTILYGDSVINYILSDKNMLCRLEDGCGNYVTKAHVENSTLKQLIYFYLERIIYFFFFKKRMLKENEKLKKRINKYYATEMAPKNLEYEEKVERINLKELWQKKNEKEQKEILDIFNVKKEILEKISSKKIILFTQPLSEDGIIEEAEKIELYKKIIAKYNEEELVIKTHPREKTKYEIIFKKSLIIKETFPSEILSFIGFKPEKAVTIFSSAVFGVGENVKIDFYGTEIHEKLYNKFGSCSKIMKTTAYLKN